MRTDNQAFGTKINIRHLEHPKQFQRNQTSQRQANSENDDCRFTRGILIHTDMIVHDQMANTGAEMMQISPRQSRSEERRVGKECRL